MRPGNGQNASCAVGNFAMGSLIPRPSSSFLSLAVGYRTASDGKLGKGLGTRLIYRPIFYWEM